VRALERRERALARATGAHAGEREAGEGLPRGIE
jgi:hypothetical protein